MLLDAAPSGLPLMVESSRAPTIPVTRRMAELGIRAGAQLTVMSRTSGGGAIVAIGDDRVAVSREILRCVQVLPSRGSAG